VPKPVRHCWVAVAVWLNTDCQDLRSRLPYVPSSFLVVPCADGEIVFNARLQPFLQNYLRDWDAAAADEPKLAGDMATVLARSLKGTCQTISAKTTFCGVLPGANAIRIEGSVCAKTQEIDLEIANLTFGQCQDLIELLRSSTFDQ